MQNVVATAGSDTSPANGGDAIDTNGCIEDTGHDVTPAEEVTNGSSDHDQPEAGSNGETIEGGAVQGVPAPVPIQGQPTSGITAPSQDNVANIFHSDPQKSAFIAPNKTPEQHPQQQV